MSKYPKSIAPDKIGGYPELAPSGGGYFYDDVLEYRVWCHLKKGSDVLRVFATYEEAVKFLDATSGAEALQALVLQREWITESAPGKFAHERSVRIAEWLVDWLRGRHRTDESIEKLLQSRPDA